jgi:hypothetical protein
MKISLLPRRKLIIYSTDMIKRQDIPFKVKANVALEGFLKLFS